MFSSLYGPIHTDTIDGFWSLVKRAIYGQFHHVSRKYLPLYVPALPEDWSDTSPLTPAWLAELRAIYPRS